MRTFLFVGAVIGLVGVAGAFGSHALRAKLTPDRVAMFEAGVRYQMWHALALFVVVLVDAWTPSGMRSTARTLPEGTCGPCWPLGGSSSPGLFLFSSSLYALALTGQRRWGAMTPLGVGLLLGWAMLLFAIVVK